MAKAKIPPYKVVMTEGKEEIIKALLSEYDIQSVQDIQEALKDLLGGTIKKMMEAEMEERLGYEKSGHSDNDDYRSGYKSKHIKSSIGEVELEVPRDKKSSFRPQVVKKGRKVFPTSLIKSYQCMQRE